MRNTELVNYNIHDDVITVNTQVRTDCHSFVFVNVGNTRVYLNNAKRLDPGATFAVAPGPINVICRKQFTIKFEDIPGVTYSTRENRLEYTKTVIEDPNFLNQ